MTVCAQHSAFVDFKDDLRPTTGPCQPANIAVFLVKVVEIENDRIILAAHNARVRGQVFPHEQSIALPAG